MNKNYADVLESYLIAEEGLFSNLRDKVKNSKLYTKLKEKNDKEMERLRQKANSNSSKSNTTTKESKPNPWYRWSLNADEILQQSRLPLEAYPKEKINDDNFWDIVEKELRIALPKILNTPAVMQACKDMCEEYNKTPKEELDDKFCFSYCGDPAKISVSWIKSQFTVELFEGGGDDQDAIFVISDGGQDFTIQFGMDVVEILGKYLDKRFDLSVSYGDGDEGCLYLLH